MGQLVEQVHLVLVRIREWLSGNDPTGLGNRQGDHPELFGRGLLGAVHFYLVSSEGHGLKSPRRCQVVRTIHEQGGDEYLLVRIDPPLLGQNPGCGSGSVEQLVVGAKDLGQSILAVQQWPVSVVVARLLVPYEGQDIVHDDEMEPVGRAEIYRSDELDPLG